MIELLEQQKKLTVNQWKLICTANLADLLDFFDFFLIGYVTAALTKQWSLTYWEGGGILLASGLGAVPGAFLWGWLGDKVGRRTVFMLSAVTIALATGVMVFTPGQDSFVPGWLFLMFFRFFVGVGNAGIFTIDLPLVQEFIPAYKRGWVSALVTTLLPGGSMLAGFAAWQLLPIVGWRGLFLVGLVPLVLVFMIRYWVPESPRG
jgi:putative MFS transporter